MSKWILLTLVSFSYSAFAGRAVTAEDLMSNQWCVDGKDTIERITMGPNKIIKKESIKKATMEIANIETGEWWLRADEHNVVIVRDPRGALQISLAISPNRRALAMSSGANNNATARACVDIFPGLPGQK